MLTRFASILPTTALVRWPGRPPFLPFYHIVSNDRVPHVAHLYDYRSVRAFEADLDFITKHFAPISLDDLLRAASGGQPIRSRVFHLTFDDGMRQVFDVAAPILFRRGVPATVFVNSAFIDNRQMFYRHKTALIINAISGGPSSRPSLRQIASALQLHSHDIRDVAAAVRRINYLNRSILDRLAPIAGIDCQEYLSTEKPYLTTAQLTSWLQKGFTIGAHSIDHPDYKLLPAAEQLRQTQESLRFVSSTFRVPYDVFAFPFSDAEVSKSYFDTVFDSQYPMLDLSFGVSGLRTDYHPRHLHRLQMDGNPFPARQLINTEYASASIRRILDTNIVRRA
jgi:peptidoglycan/xylan/chitin deacetylase (PgdA/CDA1 family)